MSIIIDPEFQALIPPLSEDEKRLLQENITKDGCRDALVIWQGILLDGHNRFEICDWLEIPYQTIEIELPDREAAKDWIDKNQLGRRNLTPDQMSLLRGRRYNRAKKTKSEAGSIGGSSKAQNDTCLPSPSTAKRLADEHGVSPATIKRDGQLAEAVEKLKPNIPDIESRIMSGDVPSKQAVIEAAKEPESAPEKLKPQPHVSYNTGENEWYTPPEYIESANKVMGDIDLDPASSDIANKIVNAAIYYSKDNDGLNKPWEGKVWMNPPYASDLIKKFAVKFASHVIDNEITEGIALVNNATETIWFKALIDCASAVVFTTGRVKFLDPQGNPGAPLQGQAIIYCGENANKFLIEFRKFGWGAKL